MQGIRILASVAGGVVLIGTSISVLKSLVMPGGRIGLLYHTVARLGDRVFWLAARRLPSYERRDRVLAFQAPVVLAGLLISWLLAYLVGFGLVLSPVVGGLAGGLRESGSSLFTLGFASTDRTTSRSALMAGCTPLPGEQARCSPTMPTARRR